MAISSPCAGCGNITSYICAAQFNHEDQHLIICYKCWENGLRCYFGNNTLIVDREAPPNYKEAALFWDEGGFVTGGLIPICYPDSNQP